MTEFGALGGRKGRRIQGAGTPGRRERQRIKYLDSITDSMDMNLSKLWEIVQDREGWHAVVHLVAESQT